MERETASDNVTINMMASRRWLTLEQLLEVLPLKKSYVYYLTHTRQIPVTRIGRRLLFDYDRIVGWLEERTTNDGESIPDSSPKRTMARQVPEA